MLTPALTYVDLDEDNDSLDVGVDTPPIIGHPKMPPLDMHPPKPAADEAPPVKQEEKPKPSKYLSVGCVVIKWSPEDFYTSWDALKFLHCVNIKSLEFHEIPDIYL